MIFVLCAFISTACFFAQLTLHEMMVYDKAMTTKPNPIEHSSEAWNMRFINPAALDL